MKQLVPALVTSVDVCAAIDQYVRLERELAQSEGQVSVYHKVRIGAVRKQKAYHVRPVASVGSRVRD
jgi:hypothetical protein